MGPVHVSSNSGETRKNTVAFAQSSKDGSPDEELERAGLAVLSLVQKASHAATEKVARVADQQQKLAAELRETKTRMKELQADLRDAQDRADRAEKWLLRIQQE